MKKYPARILSASLVVLILSLFFSSIFMSNISAATPTSANTFTDDMRNAAADYAYENAQSMAYSRPFCSSGGDGTAFVMNCLLAGGINYAESSKTAGWYFYNYDPAKLSNSAITAKALYTYLNTTHASGTLGFASKKLWSAPKALTKVGADISKLKRGDLIVFGNSTMSTVQSVSIVVKTGTTVDNVMVATHSGSKSAMWGIKSVAAKSKDYTSSANYLLGYSVSTYYTNSGSNSSKNDLYVSGSNYLDFGFNYYTHGSYNTNSAIKTSIFVQTTHINNQLAYTLSFSNAFPGGGFVTSSTASVSSAKLKTALAYGKAADNVSYTQINDLLGLAGANVLKSDSEARYVTQMGVWYAMGYFQYSGGKISAKADIAKSSYSNTYFSVTPNPNNADGARIFAVIQKYFDCISSAQLPLSGSVSLTLSSANNSVEYISSQSAFLAGPYSVTPSDGSIANYNLSFTANSCGASFVDSGYASRTAFGANETFFVKIPGNKGTCSLSFTAQSTVPVNSSALKAYAALKPQSSPAAGTLQTRVAATPSYITAQGSASLNVNTNTSVSAISLNPTGVTLDLGDTLDLVHRITPAYALNQNVTWQSSNTSVASVSGTGTVTALKAGTAVITVKTADKGLTATCGVTVKYVPVTSVSLPKNLLIMETGKTGKLTATVLPADASNSDTNWSSSNTGIVTVDGSGNLKAIKSGLAVITVKTEDKGKTDRCYVVAIDPFDQKKTGTVTASLLNVREGASTATDIIGSLVRNQKVTLLAEAGDWYQIQLSDGTLGFVSADYIDVDISVSSVTVTPDSITIYQGDTKTLSASVLPANANNRSVTWSSSNKAVVTVDSNGKITGVAPGTATITVKTNDGNKTDTCSVTVCKEEGKPDSVTVSKKDLTLYIGSSSKLTATVKPSDAANKTVNWSSSDTKIATVDGSGNVKGIKEGNAVITASTVDGSVTDTCRVAVVTPLSPEVAGTITYSSVNVRVGTTTESDLVTTAKQGTQVTIIGTCDNRYQIRLADGKIGFVSTSYASYKVDVKGVSLPDAQINLDVCDTQKIIPVFTPSNATNKNITWTSSDPSVAKVSTTGIVTAISAGTVTITAVTEDGGKKATCKVTVQYTTSQLQTRLNELGYVGSDGKVLKVDGSFGANSKYALTQFQKNAKITQTGMPDTNTCQILFDSKAPGASGIEEDPKNPESLLWPAPSVHNITSYWGYRVCDNPPLDRFHYGIDIGCPMKTDIVAVEAGVVVFAGVESEGGNVLIVQHENGYYSTYKHLNNFLVKKLDKVEKGQVIAKSGDTGAKGRPHLHFEVRRDEGRTFSVNVLSTYQDDDKRYNDTNPNPVYVKSNGKYIFNVKFDWAFTDPYYTGTGSTWKKPK